MKASILSLMFWLSATIVVSQTIRLEKTSLGSGDFHQLPNAPMIRISAIVGQPSPVNHLQNNSLHILQGFKTPYLSHHRSVKSKTISVYPNPSFGKITIEWVDEPSEEMLKIELIEISGTVVDERTQQTNGQKVTIDFSDVACGLYVLRVSGKKNGVSNTKLFFQ